MTDAIQVLQYAVSLVFVLLGLLTLRDFLRHRERSRGLLALAIGLLGVVSIATFVQGLAGPLGVWVTDLEIVVFLASGYALLLFRGTFIPIRPVTRWVVLAALLAVATAYIVVYPTGSPGSPTVVQQ